MEYLYILAYRMCDIYYIYHIPVLYCMLFYEYAAFEYALMDSF